MAKAIIEIEYDEFQVHLEDITEHIYEMGGIETIDDITDDVEL